MAITQLTLTLRVIGGGAGHGPLTLTLRIIGGGAGHGQLTLTSCVINGGGAGHEQLTLTSCVIGGGAGHGQLTGEGVGHEILALMYLLAYRQTHDTEVHCTWHI